MDRQTYVLSSNYTVNYRPLQNLCTFCATDYISGSVYIFNNSMNESSVYAASPCYVCGYFGHNLYNKDGCIFEGMLGNKSNIYSVETRAIVTVQTFDEEGTPNKPSVIEQDILYLHETKIHLQHKDDVFDPPLELKDNWSETEKTGSFKK